MRPYVIAVDHPQVDDVLALLELHLLFCNEHSPPEDVHALDLDGLLHPTVTLFSARRDRELLGIGALKQINAAHGELKSMHTAASARGLGVARALVVHLVGVARARGYRRVSLETGSMDAFAPARRLYQSSGFVLCGPFDGYSASPNSTFMTLTLGAHPS